MPVTSQKLLVLIAWRGDKSVISFCCLSGVLLSAVPLFLSSGSATTALGALRKKKDNGIMVKSAINPINTKDGRHPKLSMKWAATGAIHIDPRPTPQVTMANASPRRWLNHLVASDVATAYIGPVPMATNKL